MKINKMSRRMFLQGTGGTLLSIPFLSSLVPREARAEGEPIKRYIALQTSFHIGHGRNWFPKLTTLSNQLNIPGSPHKGSYDRLQALLGSNPALSRTLTSALNPYLNKMMLYKGLDIPSHGVHGGAYHLGASSEIWENNPKTETIDRFLAKQTKFDPAKRSAIRIGNWGTSFEKNAQGTIDAVGPVAYTAINAYNLLFNNGAYPESGAALPVHPRRDLLTRVLADYNRIKNGRQIGKSDKLVLENALDKISDLQAGLAAQVVAACRHLGQDATPANNKSYFRMDDALNSRNYANLIQAIFLCDLTRVISFGMSIDESHDHTGKGDFHGNITHAFDTKVNGLYNWEYAGDLYGKWMTNTVAPILRGLDNCIDPANGKSFLDNGLAHVSIESMIIHRQTNLPTFTVGSLNGALPTGYMVNYSDPTRPFTFGGGSVNGGGEYNQDDLSFATDPATDKHSYDYPGIPHQRFLVTLLQAMGLSPSDYETNTFNKHLENRSDSKFGSQNNGITRLGGWGVASYENTNLFDEGMRYHHDGRMNRYNFHYYKDPIPLPAKV